MNRWVAGAVVALLLAATAVYGHSPARAVETPTASTSMKDSPKPHSKHPSKKPKPHSKHPSKKPKPHTKHPAKKPPAKKHQVKVPKVKPPKAVKGRVCPVRSFAFGDGFGADRGRRSHLGQDMSGRRGAPLFAVESGTINRTKRQSNKALQIVLQGRSGSKYYYGHMDRVFIRGGQRVKAGQVIGVMGDSGSPGQVHLHFEYWKSGGESDAIDPEPFIRRICRR